MFGKKQPRLETIIGPETTLQGELNTTGTVRIDGTLEGNVNAGWVIIGEKGSIKGDVTSKGMVVGGKITGLNLTLTADAKAKLEQALAAAAPKKGGKKK